MAFEQLVAEAAAKKEKKKKGKEPKHSHDAKAGAGTSHTDGAEVKDGDFGSQGWGREKTRTAEEVAADAPNVPKR